MQPDHTAVRGDKQSRNDGAGSCYAVGGEAGIEREQLQVEIPLYSFGSGSDLSYHFGNSEEEFFEEV